VKNALLFSNLGHRRAHLAGEVAILERQLVARQRELATIDAAIRLMDAGKDPLSIKGIRPHSRMTGFKQGELTRLSLTVLRHATEPMSADMIAAEVASAKGIEVSKPLVQKMRTNLARLAEEGRIIRSGVHRGRLWAIS
jgi:hypothetical protein